MSDRARRTILERRAAFIAAAVASMGAAASCDPRANACLSATPDESAKHVTPADVGVPDTSPRVCLTESPEPCLSPPMPRDAGPMPVPCLSIAMPRDAGVKPPKP
jgi:hypothetical protein